MYINNLGHITKMAAMSIYGKIILKSFSLERVDQLKVLQWSCKRSSEIKDIYQ